MEPRNTDPLRGKFTTILDGWARGKIISYYRKEIRDFLPMITMQGTKTPDIRTHCNRLFEIVDGKQERRNLWDEIVSEEIKDFQPQKVNMDLKHAKKTDVLGPERTVRCRSCTRKFKTRTPHKLWCSWCRPTISRGADILD